MIIKKKNYDQQITFAILNIGYLINRGYKFKIGKTHKTAAERLRDADYQSQGYTHCYGLFYSINKEIASSAEAELINRFIHNDNCLNAKDGVHSINDQMGDSGEYCIYVAFKK